MLFEVFLLILIGCIKGKDQKLVKAYYYPLYNSYNTILSIGNPPSPFNMEIDLVVPFTYFSKRRYNPKISNCLKEVSRKELSVYKHTGEGTEYLDYAGLYLVNKKCDSFLFFVFDQQSLNHTFDSISFSHTFPDPRFSLVLQLYNSGEIPKPTFAFVKDKRHSSIESQNLYYGSAPNSIQEYPYKGNCKVDQSDPRWGCKLKGIKVLGQYFSNSYKSYFQTKNSVFLVPKGFYIFLSENVFKNYTEKKICKEVKKKFYCDCNSLDKDMSMEIIFEEMTIILKKNHLFEYSSSYKCILAFEANPQEEAWQFSANFLHFFDVMFDYQNHEVSFYSNETVILQNKNDSASQWINNRVSKIKVILSIMMTFLVLMSLKLFLLYLKETRVLLVNK